MLLRLYQQFYFAFIFGNLTKSLEYFHSVFFHLDACRNGYLFAIITKSKLLLLIAMSLSHFPLYIIFIVPQLLFSQLIFLIILLSIEGMYLIQFYVFLALNRSQRNQITCVHNRSGIIQEGIFRFAFIDYIFSCIFGKAICDGRLIGQIRWLFLPFDIFLLNMILYDAKPIQFTSFRLYLMIYNRSIMFYLRLSHTIKQTRHYLYLFHQAFISFVVLFLFYVLFDHGQYPSTYIIDYIVNKRMRNHFISPQNIEFPIIKYQTSCLFLCSCSFRFHLFRNSFHKTISKDYNIINQLQILKPNRKLYILSQLSLIILIKQTFTILLMTQRSYLTIHPQLYKKTVKKSSIKESKMDINSEQLAREMIEEEEQRINDLTFQIKAYKIKVEEEKYAKIDYSKEIEELEEELEDIRNDEKEILQQIQNCRLVEKQVTPLEYFLWKKKQRINTYDASIAQLYRDIEAQREYFERSLDQFRRENQDLIAEFEDIEERINNFGNIPKDQDNSEVNDQQYMNEIFGQNLLLKQQHNTLLATSDIINENRQIIGLQVADNIETIQSTLRSYFQQQKVKLCREFKQIQLQIKSNQVTPINRDDQSYSIQPLLDDYTYKLKELQNFAPESMKKVVHPVLIPLPWASFNWREYLGTNKYSEQAYNEFNQLEQQCIKNQGDTLQLQAELKKLNGQIVNEQQKSNQISINILKLKKKLQA